VQGGAAAAPSVESCALQHIKNSALHNAQTPNASWDALDAHDGSMTRSTAADDGRALGTGLSSINAASSVGATATMRPAALLVLACVAGLVLGQCNNLCSGHGDCQVRAARTFLRRARRALLARLRSAAAALACRCPPTPAATPVTRVMLIAMFLVCTVRTERRAYDMRVLGGLGRRRLLVA
jgi:hypothetical protein